MTSVKPIFQSETKSNSDYGYSSNGSTGRDGRRENPIDASTLTNTFRYSIPYTQDRSKVHARGVDQQWKRTIILTVRESFPGIYSRQPVVASKCFELSPIEVRTPLPSFISPLLYLFNPTQFYLISSNINWLFLKWIGLNLLPHWTNTGPTIMKCMISLQLGVPWRYPGEGGYHAEGARPRDQRLCCRWHEQLNEIDSRHRHASGTHPFIHPCISIYSCRVLHTYHQHLISIAVGSLTPRSLYTSLIIPHNHHLLIALGECWCRRGC